MRVGSAVYLYTSPYTCKGTKNTSAYFGRHFCMQKRCGKSRPLARHVWYFKTQTSRLTNTAASDVEVQKYW